MALKKKKKVEEAPEVKKPETKYKDTQVTTNILEAEKLQKEGYVVIDISKKEGKKTYTLGK